MLADDIDGDPGSGRQELLETLSVEERLRRVLIHVQRQLVIVDAQEDLKSKVQEELGDRQKEIFLREQMKTIQKELGEGDDEDTLITLMNSTDAMTLVRQLKENDVNLKYIWGAKGFWPIEFGEALGKDADYIVSDGHWAEALGAPGSKALGKKYRAEFGKTKYSVTIGNFYSLVQHLAQAIEAAGSIDNVKVRDVYYSGTFVAKDTVEGDLAFNKNGVAEFPAVALQWMGGKRMPVWPITPKVWTLKIIPPWNER